MSNEDDGFVEILPPHEAKNAVAAEMILSLLGGKNKSPRTTLIFRPERMPPDASRILSAPRFNVAYNHAMRTIRVKSADGMGRYQLTTLRGGVFALRFPTPSQLAPADGSGMLGRRPAEFDWNAQQGALLVEIPPDLVPRSSPARAPTLRASTAPAMPSVRGVQNVAPSLMGDPAPGRSALDDKRGR